MATRDASLEDDQPPLVEEAKECHVPGVTERFLTPSVEKEELEAMTAYLIWGHARSLKVEEKQRRVS